MKKRILYIGHLLFALLLINSCFLRIPPNWEFETENAKRVISNDAELRRLDILCEQLPKPNDFKFLGKKSGNNVKFVSNFYETSLNYNQVKQFYDEYFQNNGWKLSEDSSKWGQWFEYTKNEDYITVQRESTKEFASISCSNEK